MRWRAREPKLKKKDFEERIIFAWLPIKTSAIGCSNRGYHPAQWVWLEWVLYKPAHPEGYYFASYYTLPLP